MNRIKRLLILYFLFSLLLMFYSKPVLSYMIAEYAFGNGGGTFSNSTNQVTGIVGQSLIGAGENGSNKTQSGYIYILNRYSYVEIVIEPPSNFVVSDVLNDNGHFLQLTWSKSSSEDNNYVTFYRIYRSRNETLTDPIPLSQFTSIDSLNYYEQFYTILRDSVTAGVYEYTDFIPISGVPYTYWLEAIGNGGASEKIRSGSITIVNDNRPLQFVVNAPYPNPFNPSTTLSFLLPADSQVELVVYNIIGEKVETVANEYISAGFHSFTWMPKDMPSGMYFFRIHAGDKVDVKKVVLLK